MRKQSSSFLHSYLHTLKCVSVTAAFLFSATLLTGCSGQMESLFTKPQKVTIEHNATVEPTPTPEPTEELTPTPTPAPTPDVTEVTDSTSVSGSGDGTQSGSTSDTAGQNTSAAGNSAASNTSSEDTASTSNTSSGQDAQPEEPELPEGTLAPVGVTQEEIDAATEARYAKVIEAANNRLDHGYYSKETLISGLMEDGFSYEDATYGAEHSYIDWGY